MLTSASASNTKRTGERGFTLIETLVAILCGVIVTSALFSILEVSLRQTARLAGKVQNTQASRTTMTKIVDELRNACISKEFAPIQAVTNENELRFRSGVGSEAVLSKAQEHLIYYEKEKLYDKTYASTGGTWPNFKYSESPEKTVLLGENIIQTERSGKKVPIFQFYKYAASATSSSSSEGVSTLNTTEPLKPPLTATTAAETASVLITFSVNPTEGKQYKLTPVELSNQVTLAFSAPNAETPVVAKPCE